MILEQIYTWTLAISFFVAGAFVVLYLHNRRTSDEQSAPAGQTGTLTEKDVGLFTAFALLGSLLLVWVGLLLLRGGGGFLPGERVLLTILLLVGVAGFVLTAVTARNGRPPQIMVAFLCKSARFFQVNIPQPLLLFFALCFSLIASLAAGDVALARHAPAATLSWLLALLLAVAGSYRQSGVGAARPSRRELLFLLLLFVGALALRGTAIENIPTTFSGDEGSAGLDAVQFARGEFNNLFSVGWFSFPSFYFGVQSVGIQLWGQTVAAVRLPSVIAGSAAVLAVYWLGRRMFDRLTGGFAALYMMVAHYHIHISRVALNNVWDSLFAAVALSGLWDGWQNDRRASFILSGIALGLGQYFYASIRILPLLFLLWAGAAFLVRRRQFRERLGGLVLTAVIAFVVVLPLVLYFADHMNEFNAPLQRVTIFNGWIEAEQARTEMSRLAIVAGQMGKGMAGFVSKPLRLLYDPGAPLLLAGAAALFLLGVIWLLGNFDLRALLLFLPLIAVVLSNTLSQDPPSSQRYILAMPVVALVLAVPLGHLTGWLQRLWPQRQQAILAAAAVFMGLVMANDLRYYFLEVYDSYVMGGVNTETATEIAHYLREQAVPGQKVYFFGLPRMGYRSLSTIPYLVPQAIGEDVVTPLTAVPAWELDGPTQFLFLPEREAELDLVQAAYPEGAARHHFSVRGQHLFTSYAPP